MSVLRSFTALDLWRVRLAAGYTVQCRVEHKAPTLIRLAELAAR